ncbi:MAG: family 10 glycosylhydrolase [Planctomycetota bacterium]
MTRHPLALLIPVLAALLVTSGCRTSSDAPVWQHSTSIKVPEPPREFRAVWVATVANIDWPSEPGLSPRAQRREIEALLDTFERLRFNAIVLQVRPAADAIFPGGPEPWTEFMQGKSGKGPFPPYDPLRKWIELSHDRGMDVHLWINPYRARHIAEDGPSSADRITERRPDLVREHNGYLWLDPSEPEAIAHSLEVVTDLLRRYDADGVHMDDYFYPYPGDDGEFDDEADYLAALAAEPGLTRPAWRRRHVNRFVRELGETVRREKPNALFGISPFGIWRPDHPAGIRGFDAYERLAADAKLWLEQGWVDYLAPQLYWPIESEGQPFGPLLDWWLGVNAQDRHVWPGIYTSRIKAADSEAVSWEPDQIVRQIAVTRDAIEDDSGHIHFSAIALLEDRRAITETLVAETYTTDAVPPASPWLHETPPNPPRVKARVRRDGSVSVRWSHRNPQGVVRRWVVQHRGPEGVWRTSVVPPEARSFDAPEGTLAVAVRAGGANGALGDPVVRALAAER